jgi:hypothetical protein
MGMGTNFYLQPLCWRAGNYSTRPVTIPNGEEIITITIRGSTIGSHERKAEGSNLAHDNEKRKPTVAD